MKTNADKFQFTIPGNTSSHKLQIGDITPKSVSSVTLLGVPIDSKLNFDAHTNNIIKKHIINYMPSEDYKSF